MEELLVGGARHGEEDLVDAHLRDHPSQVGDATDHRGPGEAAPHLEPVVEDAADLVAILGEHRHPLDQQLAAGAGADHQDMFRANSPAPQARLVLAQQVALDRHEDAGDDDGVDERQSGIFKAAIERHAGQHQHAGERHAAAHGEELIDEGAAAPRSILLVDGQREEEHRHHDWDRRHIGTERQRLLHDLHEDFLSFLEEIFDPRLLPRLLALRSAAVAPLIVVARFEAPPPAGPNRGQPVGTPEDGRRRRRRFLDLDRLTHYLKRTLHRLPLPNRRRGSTGLFHQRLVTRSRTLRCADISTVSSNSSKREKPCRRNALDSRRSARCGFFGSREPCR